MYLEAIRGTQNSQVAQLCARLRKDSRDFDADGRVLRLKQYVSSDLLPVHIDAILDALAANTRVEVLYIQNFEQVRVQHTMYTYSSSWEQL